jgi:hypothetical protein
VSGEHRGGSRRRDGEYDPRSGEYRTVGGHGSGGYPTGDDRSGGHGSGAYPTGEYGSGEYGSFGGYSSGEYGSGRYGSGGYSGGGHTSGGYSTGTGGGYSSGGYSSSTYTSGSYDASSSGAYPTTSRTSGPYGTAESGPYRTATGSGAHRPGGSGDYGVRGSGEYRSTTTGEYRRPGASRTSPGSGGYRTGTGSHRIVRERGTGHRKLGLLLTGVVLAVGACVLAAFVVLGGSEEDDGNGQVGAATAGSTPSSKTERSIVADACELLPQQVADRLAPKADRTRADNYQASDRQNQCVWGVYTGENKRQLTIELRALEGKQGQTATRTAQATLTTERQADESGKALLSGQELAEKAALNGVGDEGYVIYLVDEGQGVGEAVANARMANVLITIHYSGGDDGDPLGRDAAVAGATEAAKSMVQALSSNR